jgi:hypothetical protein
MFQSGGRIILCEIYNIIKSNQNKEQLTEKKGGQLLYLLNKVTEMGAQLSWHITSYVLNEVVETDA